MTELEVDRQFLEEFLKRSLEFATPIGEEAESDPHLRRFLRDVLGGEMVAIGMTDVGYDEMGNVCGLIPGNDPKGDGVLVVGFGMTHPGAGMLDPFTPRVVDGAPFGVRGDVIIGRGAGEQKGPLAAAVAAFKTILGGGGSPRRDLFLLGLASGETGRHDAVRSALDHFRPPVQACVILVCTGNDLVVAHKGRIDLEIRITGQAAHSSSPWLGLNAIEGARMVLDRIAAIDLGDPDPDLGPRSVTITSLETHPRAVHTVPAEARMTVDWRLLPGDSPEWAAALLKEALTGFPRFGIEVVAGNYMYPSVVAIDNPLVTEMTSAVEGVTGATPRLLRIPAASDTGYLNSSGLAAILFGPGDITKAHTDEDFVVVEEAVDAARILVRWMMG